MIITTDEVKRNNILPYIFSPLPIDFNNVLNYKGCITLGNYRNITTVHFYI